MSEDFDWAPFSQGGEFVTFDNHGDEIVGTITALRKHTFDEKKGPVPLVDIQPKNGGDVVTLSGSPVNLRRQLAEIGPQVGDQIAVKYIDDQKMPGKPQPMKVFVIRFKAGEKPPFGGMKPSQLGEPHENTEDLSAYSEEPF